MKLGIHPNYRTVVFRDTSADTYFSIGSTITTNRIIERDGQTFPYVTLDISSASHPHYTDKQKEYAKEGSTTRFNQRFGSFLPKKQANPES